MSKSFRVTIPHNLLIPLSRAFATRPLPAIAPLLAPYHPPPGYELPPGRLSDELSRTAFKTGLNSRDRFLGERGCVICGCSNNLQDCHIIRRSEESTWKKLRELNWVPPDVKSTPDREPRNGMTMCGMHHTDFDDYKFFIRYMPEVPGFVLIDLANQFAYKHLHGKLIAIDTGDPLAPIPTLFLIHEMRVRGFYPLANQAPMIPATLTWQDWVISNGVLKNSVESPLFQRDKPSTGIPPAV